MSEHITIEELDERAHNEAKTIKAKTDTAPLTNKDRLAIPLQEMPVLEPLVRARQMDEVAIGYTKEQAMVEANRCLQCKNQPCVDGCPVNIHIPEFIEQIANGDFQSSVDIIKQTNFLPAICGRVCPQEKQCQSRCTVGKVFKSVEKSVAIGRLERFVADWERTNNQAQVSSPAVRSGKKVAVIGSGPAGLTVAADCARAGHDVTVFEALRYDVRNS